MLKMRLQRIGRRHDPKFRVVVTNATTGPKSNKHTEIIGFYDAKLGQVEIKADRATHWLSVGAQPSDTVYNMLVEKGVVKGRKKNALPKKTAPVKEVAAEETTEKTPTEETASETQAASEEPKAEEVKEEAPAEENKEEKTEEAAAE